MSLPLPNLDDRRWDDLVEEARALIPLYAPIWTDHNTHDPGITLLELLAWVAEMDIYQLNRIPAHHRLKFLALVGVRPEPAQPAHCILSLRLAMGMAPLQLPAGIEFESQGPLGQHLIFRSLTPVTVVGSQLAAIQRQGEDGYHNLSGRWLRGEILYLLGDDPQAGDAVYFGLDKPLPPATPACLAFEFEGDTGVEARIQLLDELQARKATCAPPDWQVLCSPHAADEQDIDVIIPPHHSVVGVWEYLDSLGHWCLLEVEDDTRDLTLDGHLCLQVAGVMGLQKLGAVDSAFYYIRYRLQSGQYDTAPLARLVADNAIVVEQAEWMSSSLAITEDAVIIGTVPSPGDDVSMRLKLNSEGDIQHLEFVMAADDDPRFTVLGYQAPSTGIKGRLDLLIALLGVSDGEPLQQYGLPDGTGLADSLQLWIQEEISWTAWQRRPDLDSSQRQHQHFQLDSAGRWLRFGDGEHGRVPPKGSLILLAGLETRGEAGNIAANVIQSLADTAYNRVLLDDYELARSKLAAVTNPLPASGGDAVETLNQAATRAFARREKIERAVTLEDIETLAMETPGVHLARTHAHAVLHPDLPCLKAPGMMTLIILPFLPKDQPTPDIGLRRVVADYLQRRRVIGSRIAVVGPGYRKVSVRARVAACSNADVLALPQAVSAALNRFFHPLHGGDDGDGWPFGRDVYRSEVFQVIDDVAGVDHVLSLELLADGCQPQCANVCLGPTQLVVAGQHQINVEVSDVNP